ncbi:MAG: sialidase family protein [Chloroflexota bacterium]|nr:sialidase family protein [Chloroflexota bacterium]
MRRYVVFAATPKLPSCHAATLTAPPGIVQPALAPIADGRLLMLLRTGGPGGRIWQATSADRGQTWNQATPTAFQTTTAASIRPACATTTYFWPATRWLTRSGTHLSARFYPATKDTPVTAGWTWKPALASSPILHSSRRTMARSTWSTPTYGQPSPTWH